MAQSGYDFAPDLIVLLNAVIDPDGDPTRYALGDEILKELYMLTPEFEKSFRAYLVA